MASATPLPQRALLNLTTSISTLRFNNDGQILAFGSRFKRDSLRLVRGRWMTWLWNFGSRTNIVVAHQLFVPRLSPGACRIADRLWQLADEQNPSTPRERGGL